MRKVVDKLPIKEHFLLIAVKVDVIDVQKAPNGQNLHRAMVAEGTLTARCKSDCNR